MKICKYQNNFVPLQKISKTMAKKTKNEQPAKADYRQELRELVNVPARELTQEQKERILQIAEELGVKTETRQHCSRCWHELAMQCYIRIAEQEQADNIENDPRRYILRPNLDVIFEGIRVNAATLTDELAEQLIARGFERKFFVKCE